MFAILCSSDARDYDNLEEEKKIIHNNNNSIII